MNVVFDSKQFRLTTFPPMVGRELMVKGEGCRNLLEKDLTAWLPILAYVEVNIIDNRWLRLSTQAMVENHVPEKYRADLTLLQLQYNCKDIELLMSSPAVGDIIWAELKDIAEQVFTCY
ncbi:hypothetical protein D3C81_527770 [compost metagenome]